MSTEKGKNEIKEIKNSPLVKILLKNSFFDEKTLQTLLLYYLGKARNFEEIGLKVGMGRSGAWKRWKRGKDNLVRAFYTLELALYLGLLEEEIAQLMFDDLADYLDLLRGKKTLQEVQENMQKRMVMSLQKGLGKSI